MTLEHSAITFSYIITDLTDHESKPIEVQLATHDEAVMYGTLLAREMLADMPDLTTKRDVRHHP